MTSAKHDDARSLLAERFGEDLVPLEGESSPASKAQPLIDDLADAISDAYATRRTGHIGEHARELAQLVIERLFFAHHARSADPRSAAIATLHMLAGWFLINPDAPVPNHFIVSADVDDLAQLEQVAAAYGATAYPHGSPVQATIYPLGEHHQPRVWMHVAQERPDRAL